MTTATFPEVGAQFVYHYRRPWSCDTSVLMVVVSVNDIELVAETVEVLTKSDRPVCDAPYKVRFADFGWSNEIAEGKVEVK